MIQAQLLRSLGEKDAAAILCYVRGDFAYFTTQTLAEASGEGWHKSPYEYNSGIPDPPRLLWNSERGCFHDKDPADWNADGSPKFEIFKAAFDGSLERPEDTGAQLSVDLINSGVAPWLFTRHRDSGVRIMAGTTLADFISLVKQAGGEVYLPCGSVDSSVGQASPKEGG